ncbi:MAG TPA: phosphatase PAP2 family protein [Solirubrobacteraceae bacterium]|nr:phosphatase PAP2 family protein [Solirubrobacteraceae bacterium]
MTRLRAAQLGGLLAVFILIGWGVGALVSSTLTPGDLDAVKDVAADRNAAATFLAHFFSWIGSGFVVFPAALATCVALYRRQRWAAALAVAISTVGAQLIIDLDKLLVGRHRPLVHRLDRVTGHSFPSGHTGQTAALCTVLLIEAFRLGAPRRRMYLATAAGGVLIACVGFSRVYLGVHYPSDVVAGALLGVSWSLVASQLGHLWASADADELTGEASDASAGGRHRPIATPRWPARPRPPRSGSAPPSKGRFRSDVR